MTLLSLVYLVEYFCIINLLIIDLVVVFLNIRTMAFDHRPWRVSANGTGSICYNYPDPTENKTSPPNPLLSCDLSPPALLFSVSYKSRQHRHYNLGLFIRDNAMLRPGKSCIDLHPESMCSNLG